MQVNLFNKHILMYHNSTTEVSLLCDCHSWNPELPGYLVRYRYDHEVPICTEFRTNQIIDNSLFTMNFIAKRHILPEFGYGFECFADYVCEEDVDIDLFLLSKSSSLTVEP